MNCSKHCQIIGWAHSKKKLKSFLSWGASLGLAMGLCWGRVFVFSSWSEKWSAILSRPLFCYHPAKAEQHISAKASKVLELFRQGLRCFALEILFQVDKTSKLHLGIYLTEFHFNCLQFLLLFFTSDTCFSSSSFIKSFLNYLSLSDFYYTQLQTFSFFT